MTIQVRGDFAQPYYVYIEIIDVVLTYWDMKKNLKKIQSTQVIWHLKRVWLLVF